MSLSIVFESSSLYSLLKKKATKEKLMHHLVESHSAVDPTYVDDFLLTYRTFLSSPLELVKNLLEWFKQDDMKTSVGTFYLILCQYLINVLMTCD